jgi:choline-sulfatase
MPNADGERGDPPNVLFLMDDQHRPGCFGFAGDETVRTPTLDRLAETGTVFERAYTPAPVCIPGRQSIMAGQLPRTTGCERYGQDLDPGYQTFARHLAEHGYATCCAGKLHHSGWDQTQGWLKRLGPTPVKRHVGDSAWGEHHPLENPPEKNYTRGEEGGSWSAAKEVRRAGVQDSRVQVADRRGVEATEQYLTQYFASPYYDRERRTPAGEDQPLLLKVSLVQPHYPYFTDEEDLFTYYLDRVEPFEAAAPDHPVLSAEAVAVGPEGDVTRREARRATAAYYAMCERVDALFGRVLDRLEHLGQDPDEWVVVYTSDHGEMLGEHGVWNKRVPYEASMRAPLLVRWPERFDPGTVDRPVSLCDLYATLCDLADLPAPEGLDSRSLVPLLAAASEGAGAGASASAVEWSDEAVSAVGDHCFVVQGDLKYCHFGDDGEEVLFDLAADPGETENRVDDPAYADAVAALRERRAELGYGPDAATDPDPGYDPGVETEPRL